MPYTISNYPNIIKALPIQAKRIWISAFNSAYNLYKGNENISVRIAWKAVENAGYKKNKDGKWIKK